MDTEGSPALEVGFVIDPDFSGLASLQQAMDSTEAKVLQEAKSIERATSGMVNLGGATAQVRAFGPAATRELQSVAAETNKAERAGESMVRQLMRQAETFGKTAAEIRNMRAEQRAAAAEGKGLTDLADRIRAANAELVRLEAGQGGVAKGSAQMRAAMQGASFQVQDLITQVSMGTNPINALAVQGGQLAGQFANVGGKAGAVASFLIGPWGIALTAGAMVLAPFVAKLLEGNSALDDAVDKLKKDAEQTRITERAKQMFRGTLEGTTAAIRDQEQALRQLERQGETATQRASILARAEVLKQEAIIETTKKLIDQAKAQLALAESQRLTGGDKFERLGGAVVGAAIKGQIAGLDQLLGLQEKGLARLELTRQNIRSFRDIEVAKGLSTEEGRLNKLYDARIESRRKELVLAGRGNEVYAETLRLEQQRATALERASKAQRDANPLGAGVSAFRSREQAIGMAGRELQGMGMRVDGNVQFGYTKGHANDAAHNRYAIDVNVGKGVTEANVPDLRKRYDEIARMYQARGYRVIWNGQLYAANGNGPTKSAQGHRDHMDIMAPASIVGKPTQGSTIRQELAELGREARHAAEQAQKLVDDATGFAANLNYETGLFGKTAAEIKGMEVAAAAAKAPTDALKQSILDAGAAWELAKQFSETRDLTEGMTMPGLDKFMAPAGLIKTDLDLMIERLGALADQAYVTGDALAEAFGRPGAVLGNVMTGLIEYQEQRAKMVAANVDEAEMDQKLSLLRQRNTMQAISGVKSLFKERTTAFKVMQGIEMAYAAWQAINTVRSIAMDTAKTSSSVANAGVRAAADGVAAVAKAIASLPFPLNLAAGAATAAALISFGVKMFGGGGGGGAVAPPSAEDLQAAAGTGTVLGDSKAKSESIARSLELVAANTNRDLEFSNEMLKSLRSIDTGISRLAGTVAQQISVAGSMFDTTGQNLGTTGKSAFLGLFGGSSTTRTLYDLGLQLNAGTVADIVNAGISGSTYQTIQQVKKKGGFLGIGGGTKTSYQTSTGAIDPAITSAINDVVLSLRNGLVSAANVIGIEGAQTLIDGFQVSIGKISFKDMTGEEIERQLSAIFSSIGDQMAGQLLPSLSSLQLVGEGLFETFTRVAREYQVVDVTLTSMGRAFGQIGLASVAARDALVQLFGGLDEFVERSEFFRDQFLTEAERNAPVQAAVVKELERLGAAGLQTRDQFKQAVLGLDLTTAAGREMYAALLALAPAFDKVIDFQEQAQKKTIDGLKDTVEQFTKLADSLRKYRDGLFATDAAQGNSYGALLARFTSTADLAKGGDQKALQELESVSKAFLDASLNNASTREQYLRDVALVARGVDGGIFAAEETADYAQLQLDALGNAVTLLGTISTNTANTAAALTGVPEPSATPVDVHVVDNGDLAIAIEDLREELAALRSDTNNGLAAIAGSTEKMARTFDTVTTEAGGTAFATVNVQ